MDRFWFAKKGYFSTHAKPTNKEKLFLSATKLQPRTAPKLTEVSKFYLRNPTVSLQYNSPFSKLRSLASAVQLPFRTDSNPHRRYPETLRFRCRWLHDDGRSLSRKPCIERRFESSPGVQRVATLDLPPHGRLAHVRSQFSLFRRSPTHKNLPPATFCTSEQFFSYFL